MREMWNKLSKRKRYALLVKAYPARSWTLHDFESKLKWDKAARVGETCWPRNHTMKGKVLRVTRDLEVRRGMFNGLPMVDWPYGGSDWILPLDTDRFAVGDRVRVTIERLPRKPRKGAE